MVKLEDGHGGEKKSISGNNGRMKAPDKVNGPNLDESDKVKGSMESIGIVAGGMVL